MTGATAVGRRAGGLIAETPDQGGVFLVGDNGPGLFIVPQ